MKRLLAALSLLVIGGVAHAQSPAQQPQQTVGGYYNSTLPILGNLQPGVLELDASGRVLVDIGAAGATVSTIATGSTIDPCANNVKTNTPIATSAGSFEIAVGVAGKKTYICSFALIAAAGAVINVIEGTGSGVCTGGTPVADFGSITAASGASIAANGGLTYGSGEATVIPGNTAGYNVCLTQSGTTALAGNATYVQQ